MRKTGSSGTPGSAGVRLSGDRKLGPAGPTVSSRAVDRRPEFLKIAARRLMGALFCPPTNLNHNLQTQPLPTTVWPSVACER